MFIETEDHIVLVTKFTVRLLLYAFGPGGCVCGGGGGAMLLQRFKISVIDGVGEATLAVYSLLKVCALATPPPPPLPQYTKPSPPIF